MINRLRIVSAFDRLRRLINIQNTFNICEARPTTSHPWRMAQLHELTSSNESQFYSSSQGTLYLYPWQHARVKVAHTMKVIGW